MPSVLSVPLPDNPYTVVNAPGALTELGQQLLSLGLGQKILVVSNPEIFAHYGRLVINSLTQAGFSVTSHLIPAGENHKTLDSITDLYDTAFKHRLERSSTLLALGGGVIGDMTGFAAATWLRGINFVQVPTSLLAMVDASIGGKTGVNHPHGKNLIGAFYQPRLVFIDPFVLKTLPEREFRAGMAEVIKYGIIWDRELFEQLEAAPRLDSLEGLSPELLETIITRSCQAKVAVVSQDEKEAGLRAILNYGHTVGHGIESLTGYSSINHGEAVALGMVVAGRLAVNLGLWSAAEAERQDAVIRKAGLPTILPSQLTVEALWDSLQMDKKVKSGQVRFILPTAIGQVEMTQAVTQAILAEALADIP
ncbi:3-dehydroquinate synthase [Synechocystis sp. LKSZ1]|uniref:3-dehydroquinate synthase n=1 Tax=Synechocystis sp. LKSZ1 TaxID=3144951 RepID=UPI00336BB524